MKVGLTGANGFTGRYLVTALADRGHQPVALRADLTDAGPIAAELASCRLDAVVHLAGHAFAAATDFARFYHVNQVGTFNLLAGLDAAGHTGIPVLLASSAHVYGAQAMGRIDEDQPVRIGSHYALSKHAMEVGAQLWAGKFRLIVSRPFNYTGRGQEERYLVPKVIGHFRRRSSTIELGNIAVRRDIGDVRDVVNAYCALIESPSAQGIFNICTQQARKVEDVVTLAARLTGHDMDVRINPDFVRAGEPDLLEGSNARLRSAIPGWEPRPLEDTIEWMLADPA